MGGGGWFCFPLLLFRVGLSGAVSRQPQISWVVTLQRHRVYQIVVGANTGPEHSSF